MQLLSNSYLLSFIEALRPTSKITYRSVVPKSFTISIFINPVAVTKSVVFLIDFDLDGNNIAKKAKILFSSQLTQTKSDAFDVFIIICRC